MGGAMKDASRHLPPGLANAARTGNFNTSSMGSGMKMPSMPSVSNFPGIPSSMKI
jgi:hypothetical protein